MEILTENLSEMGSNPDPIILAVGEPVTAWGSSLKWVRSEVEALVKLKADNVALVLIPSEENGLEILKTLKRELKNAPMPVLLVVESSVTASQRLAAYQAGTVEMIDRSVVSEVLPLKIQFYLDYYQSQKSSRIRSAIANERENFRNLYKQTPEMVCILNGPEHKFEFVNESHIKVLGFDATGKTVREVQPESVEVHGILDDVYRTGRTAELHEIPVTVGDRLRYFNLTFAARRDEGGAINGIMILGTEVSAEVKARQIRKQAQIEFEKNVDVSPAILWITERDGSCTYLSQQWYEYTGQTPEEALGFGWLDATHPEDKERTAKIYLEANAAHRAFYAEYRLRTKTGEYRWAIDAGNPRIDKDGNFLGYAGTVFDVHELKISQQKIKESQDRYMHLFNNSPLPKWIFDVETSRFMDVNETAVRHYGYSREEFLAMRVSDIRPQEDVARFTEAMKQEYALDRPYLHTGYRHVKKDGTVINVQVSTHDLILNGRKARMAAVVDVSEQVRVESQQRELLKNLELAKLEAERANQLKSAFLANMSHEIRTPLGAMLGFADLLRDPGLSRAEHANYLDILTRNGEQLAIIINDILDLSKVEAGHLKLDFTSVEPDTIAAEVISLLRVKSKEKNLALEYVRHESTPKTICSDPTRVRQVLLNLVANAIKFTRFGSVKIVSYGGQAASGRNTACFEVIDTGLGISQEQQGRIFEVFVQGDESMTRRFGGTGLGLALSRRLARALGGDVQVVRSAIDKGSTFLFQIEDQVEKADLSAASDKVESSQELEIREDSLKGLRVLVVDDSPDNQQLIWHFLTRHGATVDAADNGMLGFRKALARDYDIVLMDIQMPEMDGYTATQRLRSAGYNKPILALTAHGMTEVRKKCLYVGCTDHLTKPINSKELVSSIVRHTRH